MFPSTSKIYLVNGSIPPAGTLMRNPDYAKFLQTLLNEGWVSFYNGIQSSSFLHYVELLLFMFIGSISKKIIDAIKNDPYNPGNLFFSSHFSPV